ncbi:MAG: hypothetical protein ACU84J_10820 [Gammaproteobacteria bacterium]
MKGISSYRTLTALGLIAVTSIGLIARQHSEPRQFTEASAPSRTSHTPSLNSGRQELEDLTAAIDALKVRIAAMESMRTSAPAHPALFYGEKTASNETESADEFENIERNTVTENLSPDQGDAYLTAFRRQAIDDEWQTEMQSRMTSLLQDQSFSDTVVDNIDCRTDTCRIELAHPQGVGDTGLIEALSSSQAFSGEFSLRNDVNALGEEITVVYLARSGESLSEGY